MPTGDATNDDAVPAAATNDDAVPAAAAFPAAVAALAAVAAFFTNDDGHRTWNNTEQLRPTIKLFRTSTYHIGTVT